MTLFELVSEHRDYAGSPNCCHKALVLSLALVYYFRLPVDHPHPDTGDKINLRAKYVEEMNRQLSVEGAARVRELPFDDVLKAAMDRVYRKSTIPRGIGVCVCTCYRESVGGGDMWGSRCRACSAHEGTHGKSVCQCGAWPCVSVALVPAWM